MALARAMKGKTNGPSLIRSSEMEPKTDDSSDGIRKKSHQILVKSG